ncbi:MAG: CDP-glycerol glycerophosphotransferase family protein [Anaerovoracaceae bacterium]
MDKAEKAAPGYRITKIEWERIFLHITVETPAAGREADAAETADGPSFLLRRAEKGLGGNGNISSDGQYAGDVPLRAERKSRGVYHIMINTTAAFRRSFLANGEWVLAASEAGEQHICSMSYDVAYEKDDLSRVFRYGGGKYAYTVTFEAAESPDGGICPVIVSCFMEENRKWYKRRYVKEAPKRRKPARAAYSAVIKLIRLWYRAVYALTPKNGKRVMFLAETKPYLTGNLLYIRRRLSERGLDSRFDITVSCREAVDEHQSVLSWVRVVTQLARQDYVFVDNYVPLLGFLDLGRKTKLIQVWHAGDGFKAVGYCRFGKKGSPFPSGSCHKKYNIAITPSSKLIKVFEEVFGIEREAFRPYGMARLDGFLDEKKISDFREKFYGEHPELRDRKIILFAPTYRGTGQKTAYYPYEKLDLKRIYDFCGDEYVFMFKMHPFIKKLPEIPEGFRSRIVDLSYYHDINDLYYITDILITDYSSDFFDFALLKKPMLFYTFDRQNYELIRGVHRPVRETAPGRVCDTFDELMDALASGDYGFDRTEAFAGDNFKEYDGKASDRIIDNILLS